MNYNKNNFDTEYRSNQKHREQVKCSVIVGDRGKQRNVCKIKMKWWNRLSDFISAHSTSSSVWSEIEKSIQTYMCVTSISIYVEAEKWQ